ncbi:MAG: acyl-CoA thioesterase [Gemmatimonadota bacterium]
MPSEFTTTRRVEFADTDTAGVVHFSAFFRYMEEAEHAFYRSFGGVAYTWHEEGAIGMPRVSAGCEYLAPLRYGDEVEIRIVVREKTPKAIRYEAEFRRIEGARNPAGGRDGAAELVARGSMKVVCAERPHGAPGWRAAALPEPLRSRIEVAPSGGDGERDPAL